MSTEATTSNDGRARRRVLHLVHWPRSGITEVVRTLVIGEADASKEHAVCMLISEPGFDDYFASMPSRWQCGFEENRWRSVRTLRRCIREYGPDIIHAHSLTPALLALLLFRGPVIFHVHNEYPFFQERTVWAALKRAAIKVVHRSSRAQFIAVSEEIAKQLSGLGDSRVKVIPNGLPEGNEGDEGPLSGGGPLRLVSVCRLHPQKNLQASIRAVAKLVREGEPLEYVIYGDGPERENLENLIDSECATGEIQLAGYTEAPEAAIRSADGYVSPSAYEGFGLCIAVALRDRVPVLTTEVGEVARRMSDGTHGIMINGMDEAASETSVRRLLRMSHSERKHMTEAGRELFAKDFTLDAFLNRIHAVYEQFCRRQT